jgi:hypothetical protein
VHLVGFHYKNYILLVLLTSCKEIVCLHQLAMTSLPRPYSWEVLWDGTSYKSSKFILCFEIWLFVARNAVVFYSVKSMNVIY